MRPVRLTILSANNGHAVAALPSAPNRRIQRDDLLSQWGPAEGDEPLDVCALQISRA